jgi:predicted glycoside hydrolase/deacetylase ChbG (UPF0249 family)
MRVIINADDLGLSPQINDATFDLISAGLISSATIMANAISVEDAVKRANFFPKVSFGIHLNITAFSALSLSNGLKTILDDNGNFIVKSRLIKTSITRFLSNAIYSEFCSQVERLLLLGINISHIDSHEHIHTIPSIFPILKRLQQRYDIRKVRISRNIYLPNYRVSKHLLLKKYFYNFMLNKIFSTKTTSGFGSLEEFYTNAKSNNLKHDTVEIMVHPGSQKYNNETSILKPFWYKNLPLNIKLINYYQL